MSLQLEGLSGPLLVAPAYFPQSRVSDFAQQVWRLASKTSSLVPTALRNPPFCKISLLFETRVFFFESASMSFACHFSIENWWSVSGIFPFNRFAAIYDIESHICREQRLMAPLLVSSFASSEHFIINKGCPWASCLFWSSTLTSYISFPGYIQSKFLTANTHLTISQEHALLSD